MPFMSSVWSFLASIWSSMQNFSSLFSSYLANVFQYGFEFEHPERLWYIVPIMLIFYFFLRKDFVSLRESTRAKDINVRKRIRIYRFFMFLSRGIIFLLLVIALASPMMNVMEKIYGERSVTLLVDKSDSMKLYGTSFVPSLQFALEQLSIGRFRQ